MAIDPIKIAAKDVTALLVAGVMFALLGTKAQETGEINRVVCSSEIFSAVCEQNEVILITNALYGRMRLNRCVLKNFGFMCTENATGIVSNHCSGRHSCELKVLDENLPGVATCHEDLKSYLEVTYVCLKVASPEENTCSKSGPVKLTSHTGYISNIVSEETSCGTSVAPWEITAELGKQIKLTLIDFTIQDSQPKTRRCMVYGTVREKSTTRSSTICSGTTRETHIYTSTTNSVEIIFISAKSFHESQLYFLFYFEVIGCTDPEAPSGGWVQRNNDVALVGCNAGIDKTWQLVCTDGAWKVDEKPNCTDDLGLVATTRAPYPSALPFGIIVVIVLPLALVIGILVLVVGLWLIGRRPSHHHSNSSTMRLDPAHATYHELCDKHHLRVCDYEECPRSRCALHPANIATSQANSFTSRPPIDDDYGTAHLLRTAPDVVQDDCSIYDETHRLTSDENQHASIAMEDNVNNAKTVAIDVASAPTKTLMHRNYSSDALRENKITEKDTERLVTILRSPIPQRTQMTLPLDQFNNLKNKTRSYNLDIGHRIPALHSYSCMKTSKGHPSLCRCPGGKPAMQTFRPVAI